MEQFNTGKSKVLWIVVAVIAFLAIGTAIWYFTKSKPLSARPGAQGEANKSKVYAPKNTDWTVYRSSKYSYNVSFPKDYTLGETGDKSINLSKNDKILVELYVASAGPIESSVALYTDDSKGYMTGGKAESVTIAGTTGKKVTGTFGKWGGNRQKFEGIKGSTTIFNQGNWTFYLNSYDNADPATMSIFNDIAADLQF